MSQCCWVKPGAIWACALLLKSHARHKMCCNLPALAQGFSAVLVKCAHSHAAWMRAPESCSAEKLLLLLSSVSSLKTSPVLICLCLVWCQEEEDCFWLCWYLVVVELVSFLNSACVKQPITRVSGHPGQWSSCHWGLDQNLGWKWVFTKLLTSYCNAWAYQRPEHIQVQILKVEKRTGEGGSQSIGEGLCCLFIVVFVTFSPLYPEVMKCFYSSSVIVWRNTKPQSPVAI